MSYADVIKEPQRWAAQNWLPMDVMVLGAGAGGISKGRVACSEIASITTGTDFFGGAVLNPYGPRDVIAWTPEDKPKTAMAWRLDAAGADRSRVHDITTTPDGDKRKLTESSIDFIIAKAKQIKAMGRTLGMVYIDPLSAVLPAGVNISTNAGARANVVDLLDDLADELGDATGLNMPSVVLLNAHTVKDGSIQGSAGLVQACRHVLLYRRGKRGVCTMSVHKSNIGPDEQAERPDGEHVLPPLRYHLIGTDDSDMRVEWLTRPAQRAANVRPLVRRPVRGPVVAGIKLPTTAQVLESLREQQKAGEQ